MCCFGWVKLIVTGGWEGTQPGQLTLISQRDIWYHMASCPLYIWGNWLEEGIAACGSNSLRSWHFFISRTGCSAWSCSSTNCCLGLCSSEIGCTGPVFVITVGWASVTLVGERLRCSLYILLLLLFLLFICPFAALSNCFYSNSQVLPFVSWFPPPSCRGEGRGVSKRPRGPSCWLRLNQDTQPQGAHGATKREWHREYLCAGKSTSL